LAIVTKIEEKQKLAKLHELGFELILHPLYSPDLIPSDFFLFPNLKMARWNEILVE